MHTEGSSVTSMFKVSQAKSNKGREYVDLENGFSCVFKSANINSPFTFSPIECLITSLRSA